jgi:hypothetical protein
MTASAAARGPNISKSATGHSIDDLKSKYSMLAVNV